MSNQRLYLTKRLQLGHDALQWKLYRFSWKHGWQGRCFVRTRKALLLRYIRENWPDEEAQAEMAMAHLPDTFEVWKASLTPGAVLEGKPGEPRPCCT